MTWAKPQRSPVRPMRREDTCGERDWVTNGGTEQETRTAELEKEYARIFGEDAAAALDRDEDEPNGSGEVNAPTKEWANFAEEIKRRGEEKRREGQKQVEPEELEDGARRTVKMQDPKLPSVEEIREHSITHLPYRSWCRHCVRGRGREMNHKAAEEKQGMHEIHMDLCFPGEEDSSGNLTVMVARERAAKMTMAAAIPSKTTGTFIAKRVVAFMREVGCEQGDVLVKTDQENAMKSIVTEVGRVRAAAGGGRMVVESSPVGQSQSNGVVERAIGSVEGQLRVLRDALEGRLGVKLEVNHPVMTWLVEYAALALNRFEVGKDGRTAYERCKGKKAKTMGIEFGEAILWKRKPDGGAPRQVGVSLERRRVLGGLGEHGGDHRGGQDRCVEDADSAAEASGC